MSTITHQNIKDFQKEAPENVREVLAIALYLMYLAKKEDTDMNPLKLQKLLYYCQAYNLADHNEPMFNNKIEAWVHGGVVPDLYFHMRGTIDREEMEGIKEVIEENDIDHDLLDEKKKETINKVFGIYGGLTGFDLEMYNHREKAWQKAREGLDRGQVGTQEIDRELMKDIRRKGGYERV